MDVTELVPSVCVCLSGSVRATLCSTSLLTHLTSIMAKGECLNTTFLPPASAVEVTELVPSVCMCVSVWVCESHVLFMNKIFVETQKNKMAKGLSSKRTGHYRTLEVRHRWGVFEPPCANCTVGSYASLSVCPSGPDQKSD